MWLILWLGVSPRLLCLIPTIIETWYKLRVQDWMVGCWTLWMWRYAGRCQFGCSFFLSFLLFSFRLYFMDLGPVQMSFAWLFTTSGDMSRWGGVSPCAGSTERSHWAVLISCGTYRFVHLRTLNSCLIVFFPFLLLYRFMQPMGLHLKMGII